MGILIGKNRRVEDTRKRYQETWEYVQKLSKRHTISKYHVLHTPNGIQYTGTIRNSAEEISELGLAMLLNDGDEWLSGTSIINPYNEFVVKLRLK
jgi:hypothetical protein